MHDDGRPVSVLRCVLSILNGYHDLLHRPAKLYETYPGITKLLNQWEKKETRKKSSVFTKDEVFKFLNELRSPDDEKYLPRKVCLILGLNGLLRKSELIELETDNIHSRR